MATADRKPSALDVVGQVMVEMGGDSASIEAVGDRIVVRIPSFRSGLRTIRGWSRGPGRGESIGRIHEALKVTRLSLEIVMGGRTVGRLGVGATPGRVSRLLGLGPMEIEWGGVLGSLRRSQPPGVTRL